MQILFGNLLSGFFNCKKLSIINYIVEHVIFTEWTFKINIVQAFDANNVMILTNYLWRICGTIFILANLTGKRIVDLLYLAHQLLMSVLKINLNF
jgi:hypothetical protein